MSYDVGKAQEAASKMNALSLLIPGARTSIRRLREPSSYPQSELRIFRAKSIEMAIAFRKTLKEVVTLLETMDVTK